MDKIGTANSGVPIEIGHTTSEVTINDNLSVTGNVGIGTTSPSNTLQLMNLDDTVPILGLRSGNSTTTINDAAQIAFGCNGTDDHQHFIHTRHNK